MSIKIYKSGGLIFAEETGKDLNSFTPSGVDLWVSGEQVGFTDVISKQTENFGVYSNIRKEDNSTPSSLSDAVIYLSGLYSSNTTITDSSGNELTLKENINSGNAELLVNMEGHICADNSTSTPLLADAVFTGDWQQTVDYGVISIDIATDEDSATDGLVIQWSNNGTDVHNTDEFTILADRSKTFTFGPANRYVKIMYTNGSTDQGTFELSTILRRVYVKPSSHRISDSIIGEDDAELVKAVLTGSNPAGNFVNFQSTTSGNFKMSLEEFENAVSVNSNTQLRTTLFDSAGQEFKIDAATSSFTTVDYEHHEIHGGSHYFLCNFETLASAATVEFGITTPDTPKWTHLLFSAEGTSQTEVRIYESATVTGGTATVPFNNNRNSTNTSGMTVVKNPTVSVQGNLIFAASHGLAGTTPSRADSGGVSERNKEIILKQDTTYIFEITSADDDNIVTYCGEWYEHTNV